jgi:hypothetical protein
VPGIFWYVSRSKVDALRDDYGSLGRRRLRDISLKLKTRFVDTFGALHRFNIFPPVQQTPIGRVPAASVPAVC